VIVVMISAASMAARFFDAAWKLHTGQRSIEPVRRYRREPWKLLSCHVKAAPVDGGNAQVPNDWSQMVSEVLEQAAGGCRDV
jgi:hypothetical protein